MCGIEKAGFEQNEEDMEKAVRLDNVPLFLHKAAYDNPAPTRYRHDTADNLKIHILLADDLQYQAAFLKDLHHG